MIERVTIEGREATVIYIDRDFNPVDRDEAMLAKIVFDDGTTRFAVFPRVGERDDD